jgi:hypothetical protein
MNCATLAKGGWRVSEGCHHNNEMQKLLYILNKLITVWYNYSQLSPLPRGTLWFRDCVCAKSVSDWG